MKVNSTLYALRSTLAFFLLCFGTATLLPAQTTWTSRTAPSVQWRSVTYGNGLFVAVAEEYNSSRVMTSPDGITWTSRTAEGNAWSSVTYGNGLFVAVANNGSPNSSRVMTSPDGVTWTPRTAATNSSWQSVTYGNGLFVAVNINGTASQAVMTSPNGINWTSRTAATDNSWYSVTYGNGLFVAVARTGTNNRVMTSPNGTTWTSRTSAANNNWLAVTYGNGLFVAVSSDGTNRVMTSPDGITWTGRTAAEANSWCNVTYGNGLFVAISYDGTNRVMTSPDGITWTSRAAAEANSWSSVTYGNGLYVAVAGTGTNRVMTSPDCNCDPACRPIPTAAGTYTATTSHTDGSGVTHYCDATGNLLLSTKPVVVGSTTTVPAAAVQVKIGSTAATYYPKWCGGTTAADKCFMVKTPATGGNVLINRWWHIDAAQVTGTAVSPANQLEITTYFTNTEFTALQTQMSTNSVVPALTSPTGLILYQPFANPALAKFADPALVKPLTFTKVVNGASVGVNLWQHSTPASGINQATFKVNSIVNSGGIGIF